MNKTQKIKNAAQKTKRQRVKQWFKKVLLFPWRVIKAIWRFICRICRAFWNWLKSIDIVGMINLTLLVIIIVLFSALINNFVCCNKRAALNAGCTNSANKNITATTTQKNPVEKRKVVKRTFKTTLPLKADPETNIKPKIRTVGVKKPQIIKEASFPAEELPQQNLSGDVIVDLTPSSPVLSNGVKINGNLFVQNIRKYTLPCGAKINGHLIIRNVDKLNFCGDFTVNGNIYVNRQSSFGPLPSGARIRGQIVL